MTPWAHLPNAALIDEVLASVKADSNEWGAARDAARDAARGAACVPVWDTDWSAAWDAVAALIAYDDAGKLIKQPVAHLQGLYRLDPHPMFLLLQPASAVFNQPEFKTCVSAT